jgi:hypothetical protein
MADLATGAQVSISLAPSASFGQGTPKEVLSALFGAANFDCDASAASTAGPEKRLELDLRKSHQDAHVTEDLVKAVAAKADLHPIQAPVRQSDDGEGFALICEGAILLAMPCRLIVTCDMAIPIHRHIPDFVAILSEAGFEVEWASFKRKNNAAPWGTPDKSGVEEYAVLKQQFPSGNSFVLGAVDHDHYFMFIYDAIRRPNDNCEIDSQLNIKLYDANAGEDDSTIKAFHIGAQSVDAANLKSNKTIATQRVVFSGKSTYDLLRLKASGDGNVIAYETNAEVCDTLPALSKQVLALRPARFTISLLVDPQSATRVSIKSGKSIGVEPDFFPGYTRTNRVSNVFQHGYVAVKVSYAMAP